MLWVARKSTSVPSERRRGEALLTTFFDDPITLRLHLCRLRELPVEESLAVLQSPTADKRVREGALMREHTFVLARRISLKCSRMLVQVTSPMPSQSG